MKNRDGVNWTNESVLSLAKGGDPIVIIEKIARELVFKAREKGWQGPPFNPLFLAKMLDAEVEANSNISDARLLGSESGAKIEFNPQQPRTRVRFSIAHEVAHMLFPDWRAKIRNRKGQNEVGDNWQIEMLCNIAASEFVLPAGSIEKAVDLPGIEDLLIECRKYDVSFEAFLIRFANISKKPVAVFFSSPFIKDNVRRYKVDYMVGSPTAPRVKLAGKVLPENSVARSCVAIGYTDKASEDWVVGSKVLIEYVGLPAYTGSAYPRVAGLIRFEEPSVDRKPICNVFGNILSPRGEDEKIVCQLVNDRALRWGGGVARQLAKKYPSAEEEFAQRLQKLDFQERLGKVIFTKAENGTTIASMIAQEGFGPSPYPRIRYSSLEKCLNAVTQEAKQTGASIHLPKIGTGAAGGSWSVIEEMIDQAAVRSGLSVLVYDKPPKKIQLEMF